MGDTAVSRTATRWALRCLSLATWSLVIWPVTLVARETFANGLAPVIDALRQPEVIFAFQLTLSAAFWAVVINTIFGVGISLLLVRYTFPGRRTLNALVDLPLAVSPVVVGLSLVLVYSGRTGWLGGAWSRPAAGHLCAARDHPGHRVRQHATGDSRGCSGAPGDRD